MNGTFKEIVACFFILLLASCGEKLTTEAGTTEIETYQLTAMASGQLADAVNTALAWEEAYMLKSDFSFEKIRVRDGKSQTATGNYERIKLTDGEYFILNYESADPLIGNCTGDYTESLRIISTKELQGTWNMCDGPMLTYTLKK